MAKVAFSIGNHSRQEQRAAQTPISVSGQFLPAVDTGTGLLGLRVEASEGDKLIHIVDVAH